MKIAFLGDLALFGRFNYLDNKSFSIEYFKDVSIYLKKFDYVVANLETPLTNYTRTSGVKSAYIKSIVENVELLKYLGVNIVNLSNNHILDYGEDGLKESITILELNNIKYFGVYDKELEVENICFKAYTCYSTNPLGVSDGNDSILAPLSKKQLYSDLFKIRNRGKIPVISAHFGLEHVNKPSYDHIDLFTELAEKTDFILYGHHPHVLQPIVKYKSSILAYSLGNFCFDDVYTNKSTEPLIKLSQNNKESVILEVDFNQNKGFNFILTPIYIGNDFLELPASNKILDKVKDYNHDLKIERNEYTLQRTKFLRMYYKERKKKRDLNWYLKRLNFKSIRMILNARFNHKMYLRSIIGK
ncbi:CapA family protein [Halosquirtibacter xylanolyticus]|uniref:CapA family protein n=1 Tax=Halosquirtibacter xylanolyticus TaxID=3374599 RepID=UPI00374A85FA|nr:CapA family protein [Prolixibacteraceae bacterium]